MSAARDLRADEVNAAVPIVARAFAEDPALAYLLPDPRDQEVLGPWLVATWIRYARGWGRAWCTEGLEGVALRRPPGATDLHPWGVIASGMVWTPFQLGFGASRRLLAAARATDARHAKTMPSPHWYCWMIAVDPAHPGEGHGSALMAHTFDQADMAELPCYLETTHERALAIHTAHGFEVVSDDVVPDSELRVWTMCRMPRRRLILAA